MPEDMARNQLIKQALDQILSAGVALSSVVIDDAPEGASVAIAWNVITALKNLIESTGASMADAKVLAGQFKEMLNDARIDIRH